eukprot:Rhum_TRINITY_DN14813_c16_g1::Rhum_TRINITY_DN14813_c16_g1_i1::g.120659::m.120659
MYISPEENSSFPPLIRTCVLSRYSSSFFFFFFPFFFLFRSCILCVCSSASSSSFALHLWIAFFLFAVFGVLHTKLCTLGGGKLRYARLLSGEHGDQVQLLQVKAEPVVVTRAVAQQRLEPLAHLLVLGQPRHVDGPQQRPQAHGRDVCGQRVQHPPLDEGHQPRQHVLAHLGDHRLHVRLGRALLQQHHKRVLHVAGMVEAEAKLEGSVVLLLPHLVAQQLRLLHRQRLLHLLLAVVVVRVVAPHVDHAVRPARDEPPLVAVDVDAPHAVSVPGQRCQVRVRLDAPHLHHAVGRRAEQLQAVVDEGHRQHRRLVSLERLLAALALVERPQLHRGVAGAAGHPALVRAEGDAVDALPVALQGRRHLQGLAALHRPDADGLVLAARRSHLRGGAHAHAADVGLVRHGCCGVRGRLQHDGALGRQALLLLQLREALLAAHHVAQVPQLEAEVCGGGDEGRRRRRGFGRVAEAQRGDVARVSLEGRQAGHRLRVPDLDSAVLAAGGEVAAAPADGQGQHDVLVPHEDLTEGVGSVEDTDGGAVARGDDLVVVAVLRVDHLVDLADDQALPLEGRREEVQVVVRGGHQQLAPRLHGHDLHHPRQLLVRAHVRLRDRVRRAERLLALAPAPVPLQVEVAHLARRTAHHDHLLVLLRVVDDGAVLGAQHGLRHARHGRHLLQHRERVRLRGLEADASGPLPLLAARLCLRDRQPVDVEDAVPPARHHHGTAVEELHGLHRPGVIAERQHTVARLHVPDGDHAAHAPCHHERPLRHRHEADIQHDAAVVVQRVRLAVRHRVPQAHCAVGAGRRQPQGVEGGVGRREGGAGDRVLRGHPRAFPLQRHLEELVGHHAPQAALERARRRENPLPVVGAADVRDGLAVSGGGSAEHGARVVLHHNDAVARRGDDELPVLRHSHAVARVDGADGGLHPVRRSQHRVRHFRVSFFLSSSSFFLFFFSSLAQRLVACGGAKVSKEANEVQIL